MRKDFRKVLGMVLFLYAVGFVCGHATGCKPPPAESVENAAAVIQYKALLADCRQKGRDHKSYAVYAECADEVDRWLCTTSALRCTDGGE
jgi:hypothetical protein